MPSCLCTELGVDTYMFREYAITLGNELQKPLYIFTFHLHFIAKVLGFWRWEGVERFYTQSHE
jgi:hypothetical protein